MTHEYGDPISAEAIDAAVSLTLLLKQREPDAPLPQLAEHAVHRAFCACVNEIEHGAEGCSSGVHAALVEEVAHRAMRPYEDRASKESVMSELYAQSTPELQAMRRALAPEQLKAFREFSHQVFAEGALSAQVKQLIAVAVAHTTQCPYCIRGHTEAASKAGATEEQIMEAIWVAAEMRAGAAYAHSTIALDTLQRAKSHA